MNKRIFVPLVVIFLFGIMGLILLIGSSSIFWTILFIALLVAFFAWTMPAILRWVNVKVWIVTGLLILLGLIFPTSSLMSREYEYGPFSALTGTILFLLPSFALVNVAFLLFSVLSRTSTDIANDRSTIFSLALSALLIIKTLLNLYDLTLWDNTYDPLGYLWLIVPIFTVALSGLALSIALPGGLKLAGSAYSILIPIFLIAVSAFAQSVDFRLETIKRAERTVQAIESYYEREGKYPETLSQLSPWYIISIPKPMIIYGQDWCYENGQDYYRLGYIDREHWSNPNLIGRAYKSVSDVPSDQKICKAEFTTIQNSQPDYPYTYSMGSE